jgi:hypothetical protein
VDKQRRLAWKLLKALAVPLVLALAISLAVLAALFFYVLAAVHGCWLLCRTVKRWLWGSKDEPVARKPHFLETPAPYQIED